MDQIKIQILKLATELLEEATSEKARISYISGVPQSNAAFAYSIFLAYHNSEFQLASLLKG